MTYDFAQPSQVHSVTVSWFDDTGTGECRLPKSWRILYRARDGGWLPVKGASEYPVRKSTPITVAFDPVTTSGLRLEVELPADYSAGLYEWEVR